MSEKKAKEAKKAAPVINWRVAADRNVYGEKTELKSLPGFWVQPRRLSKGAEADINAIIARQQMKQSSIRRAILAEQDTSELSEADRLAGVVPAEVKERILVALSENLDAETVGQIEAKVERVAHGVHAHNFNGEPEGGTTEWARSLLEYSAIFDEILGIVEAKNLPL